MIQENINEKLERINKKLEEIIVVQAKIIKHLDKHTKRR